MSVDLDILPYPIAIPFRRIRACHNEDARRLKYIIETAEMTARFLAVVVLSDLRDRVKSGEVPPPQALSRPVENLRRPSFGHWIEILREGIRVCAETDRFFMPELRDFVFASKIGSPAEPFVLLNDMVALRNRLAHGGMPQAEIQRACKSSEKTVGQILKSLSFLETYKTYFVKCVKVHKRRLEVSRFAHEFWLLCGACPDPVAVSEERPWHTDTDGVIIQKQDDAYINLDPLLIYLDSDHYDEDTSVKPDLYIFNGFDKRRDRLDIRYLPCGRSGAEFWSKDLPDESEQEMLVKGVAEYSTLFGDAEASLPSFRSF